MQAITALSAVIGSNPENNKENVKTTIEMKYKKINAKTEKMILFGIGMWPMRIGFIACGWRTLNISRPACFHSNKVRNILMPPPVEPVQAVMQLKYNIHQGTKAGHWVKSVLMKPLVVAIEIKLKPVNRNAE